MYHLIQCIQAEGGARAKERVLYFIIMALPAHSVIFYNYENGPLLAQAPPTTTPTNYVSHLTCVSCQLSKSILVHVIPPHSDREGGAHQEVLVTPLHPRTVVRDQGTEELDALDEGKHEGGGSQQLSVFEDVGRGRYDLTFLFT